MVGEAPKTPWKLIGGSIAAIVIGVAVAQGSHGGGANKHPETTPSSSAPARGNQAPSGKGRYPSINVLQLMLQPELDGYGWRETSAIDQGSKDTGYVVYPTDANLAISNIGFDLILTGGETKVGNQEVPNFEVESQNDTVYGRHDPTADDVNATLAKH